MSVTKKEAMCRRAKKALMLTDEGLRLYQQVYYNCSVFVFTGQKLKLQFHLWKCQRLVQICITKERKNEPNLSPS